MKSEHDSENIQQLAKTLSQHENTLQPNIKRNAKSADGEPEDRYQDYLYESLDEERQPHIKPVIKKEDLNEQILGKDIVRSEQFSIDAELLQSANKQQFSRELQIMKQGRTTNLNIIVCGAKETGKTCFIDTFSNSKLCNPESIKNETKKIVTKTCLRKFHGAIYNVDLIDAPGYAQGKTSCYIELIRGQIQKRLESHYKRQQQERKDRKRIIQRIKGQKIDQRIHCCLYFIKGPRIHHQDCLIMLALQDYVSIIPIISKGDCYTFKQIKQIKKDLYLAKEKYKLKWLECEEVVRSNNPQMVKFLLQGSFGPAPPFVIVSGVQTILTGSDRIVQGREYTWGVVDINNRKHSDFQLLCQILLIELSQPLIEFTGLIQSEYVRNRVNQKQNSTLSGLAKYFGGGVFMGVIGWLIYKSVQKKTESN